MGRALVGAIVGLIAGLLFGCLGGFFLGIWSTDAGKAAIEDFVSNEEAADTGRTRTISRAAFEVDYPGNWKIDTVDEDYDPDHLFSIDSPGSCFVQFLFFDTGTDPKDNVDAQVQTFVPKLIKSPKETTSSEWGSFRGDGIVLEGKILGINDGSIRVFSHSADDRSFTVVEMCFDEDIASVEPGFELVRKSFRLKR